MAINYHVYLTYGSAAAPETGDEGDDWIKLLTKTGKDSATQNNKRKHMASHKSFRINIGKFKQSITLTNVVILKTGGWEGATSTEYNVVKYFLLKHMSKEAPGSELGLVIYEPLVDGSTEYIEWMDSSEEMVNHCQCTVTGYSFNLDATKMYYIGNITLEESWNN